jgi:hypothetical protein
VRRAAVFLAVAAGLLLANCKGFGREMWAHAMRGSGAIVACVGLALLVGGCDLTRDARFFREGIGTDLYWDGLPAATQLQDIYLANICSQAISPTARSVDTVSCDGLPLTPRNWGLLVQAGMNDIDLRCDAYLAWLYDRKSSKEPFLKELASLGGAAAGILRATNAGQTPIALTAIAFGLAAETFTNIDQRLVNAVDYTTVDSVVRDNRTQFRFKNLDLVIDNRPAAIYVLRNYLSICVPDSIEMSINNTVNVYHRAGPDALRMDPIGLRSAPATSGTSAAVRGALLNSIPKGPRDPLPGVGNNPPPPPVERKMAGRTDTERNTTTSIGQSIQSNLCVAPSTSFETTRDAIEQAKLGANQSGPGKRPFDNTENQIVSAAEAQIFRGSRPCNLDMSGVDRGYHTAFEKFAFANEAGVVSLQQILAVCDPNLKDKFSGRFDEPTRTAITVAKNKVKQAKKFGLTDPDTDTLNDKSYNAISRTCK